MNFKKFLYYTPLLQDLLVFNNQRKSKKNINTFILSNQTLNTNSHINNTLLNLWRNNKYIELASLFKEKPDLFIKEQKAIVFNHLTNFIFCKKRHSNINSEIETSSLFGFLLLVESHPSIKNEFSKYLTESYIKEGFNSQWAAHSLSGLLFLNQFDLDIFEAFIQTPSSNKDLLHNIVDTYHDISTSINYKDFYKISSSGEAFIKLEPNHYYTPYENQPKEKKVANLSSESFLNFQLHLATRLSHYIVEHNLNKSNTLPLPIVISISYLIHKEKIDENFRITDKDIAMAIKSNNIYQSKMSRNPHQTIAILEDSNQAISFFNNFKINSSLVKTSNNNKSDYLTILQQFKSENVESKNNLSFQEIVHSYFEQNPNPKVQEPLDTIINAINKFKKEGENNIEIESYCHNLEKTIIKLLDNYQTSLELFPEEDFSQMITEPLQKLKNDIHQHINIQQEQHIDFFVKKSQKVRSQI